MSYLKKLFGFGKNPRYQQAINHYNKCEYREALNIFEELIADRTYQRSLHYRLAEFYTSQSYRNLGIVAMHEAKFKDAINYFNKSLAILPQAHVLHNYLGICYNNIGLYHESIAEFMKLLRENPDDIQTAVRLALAYYNKGDYRDAAEKLKAIITAKPQHADFHYLTGLVYCNLDDYQAGVSAFRRALEINPSYVDALSKLGLVLVILERYREAHEILRNLVNLVPTKSSYRYCLALSHNLLGATDEARREFAAIKKLGMPGTMKEVYSKEESRELLIGKASDELSKAVMIDATFASMLASFESAAKDIGLYNTLVRIYTSVLEEHPNYADFRHKLGQVYENLHRHDDAIREFIRALEINPHYMHARVSLALAYKESGDFQKAIQEFRFVLEQQGEFPFIYFQLAIIYKETGERRKAIDALSRALELKPGFRDAQHLLDELRSG